MLIQAFSSGPLKTNAYVVACKSSKKAVVIDPAPESADSLSVYVKEQGLTPQKILLTHTHWDHIADVAALKKKWAIPVYVHPADLGNLEHPGSDGLPCWIPIQGVVADALFEEDNPILFGDLNFKVIETPGHTPGGVCFYNGFHGVLISGDTLFKGSIGNLSFPTSDSTAMWASLDKLAKLPPSTKVYPGHGPPTTIGEEKWLPRAKEIFG